MFLEKKTEAFEAASVVDKIFLKEKSTNFAEKYTAMTSMNGFEPTGEGGAYPQDEMQEGYDKIITNITWKDKFVITQEMVEDSKLMDLKKKPTAFINGYYRTREQLGAALLAGAVDATTTAFKGKSFDCKSADGKALFAEDHPSKVKGASQSNKFSDTFSVDKLNMLECKMQNYRDDNNNILALAPDTIIIPNDATLKKAVFAAVGADQDPATANNGFNYQYGRWTIIVWAYLNQYLSSTTPWMLFDSKYNEENGSAIWQDRIPLTIKSHIDENTDNNVWGGRARFAAGFNDWRAFAVAGVTGASDLT
jgi:hypothetical protein